MMFRLVLEWWNNGKQKEEGFVKPKAKEEWVYKTSILDDLYSISDMLDKTELIQNIMTNIKINEQTNKIWFFTKGYPTYFVIDALQLESLTLDEDYASKYRVTKYNRDWEMSSQLDRFFDEKRKDDYNWTAKYDEYKEKYFSENYIFSKEKVQPLIEIMKKCFSNNQYSYIFCKYEDSITTVKNAIEEVLLIDSNIPEYIFEKCEIIFSELTSSIETKNKEISDMENIQDEAVRRSVKERLEMEIEYINKFVKM